MATERYGWIVLSGRFAMRALTILDNMGATRDYQIALAHSDICWSMAESLRR